jgi:hypothetical protein
MEGFERAVVRPRAVGRSNKKGEEKSNYSIFFGFLI